ncbi:dickkopf-related protein 1 [Octodon degus]|uniref:Dickkopf-related protein 1 n=1 Tax=Octodon degus TaxID=10160 RepID=A0A6P3VBY0_OCTDE|nr:dickkopf-related protein 1 [Octodon degus]
MHAKGLPELLRKAKNYSDAKTAAPRAPRALTSRRADRPRPRGGSESGVSAPPSVSRRPAGPSPCFEIPAPLSTPGAERPIKAAPAAVVARSCRRLQSGFGAAPEPGWDPRAASACRWGQAPPASPRSLPVSCSCPSAMPAAVSARLWVTLVAVALGGLPAPPTSATMNSVLVNSNAIKNLPPPLGGAAGHPGSAVSAAPGLAYEGGNKYQALGNYQPYACAQDEDCSADEFCSGPARAGAGGTHVCLACRKRRKRCLRHAMCCPGNYCRNGICMPSDHSHFHRGEIEETIVESFGNDQSTLDGYSRRTTLSSKIYHTKGQEGSVCLRSSDCATGLCCARHFWSKICKPVLKEGQVCTKHRRKGSHGLEIFQRCYCGEGLSCRIQRDHQASNSSRLHTCQRH